MENKKDIYILAFDVGGNFKEVRAVADPYKPFAIDQDMKGGSIYVLPQKEFKKLIESAMLPYTSPVGEHIAKADRPAAANKQHTLPPVNITDLGLYPTTSIAGEGQLKADLTTGCAFKLS